MIIGSKIGAEILSKLPREFPSFDDEKFEEKAVEVVNKYKDPFGDGLGYGLGDPFPSLDQQIGDKIWSRLLNLLRTNIKVGFGFGYGKKLFLS